MVQKKQKYYVVWQGHTPGIYSSWEKCLPQVKNYPDARYKAFPTKAAAEEAWLAGPSVTIKRNLKSATTSSVKNMDYVHESISVDAACSGNPGLMEYRGVWTADHAELFHLGPFREGTNNIGEFLAIVHALALLKKNNDAHTLIYSDSKTAISWVKRKKANTKLAANTKNADLFELIRRAEKWLHQHEWKNPVLKWETEKWGEIPADFGRK
jgi:ribonuclease HI